MNTTSLPVNYISDTAFLTALYRAIESERADAHFQDPYARLLTGVRGEQLAEVIPNANAVATGCAVRTCVFDELILRVIEKYKVDTLLNLGSGLDTRPYRLPIPSSLHWVEVDQPNLLTYKAKKLSSIQPTCKLKLLPLDINDTIARQKLLQNIGKIAKQGLVVTEGLLIYMRPKIVASLAKDLHAQSKFRWWLLDLASPLALQIIQQNLEDISGIDEVKMQFAPPEGTEFFQQYGWKCVEFKSFEEEAQRLQRGGLPAEVLTQLSQEQWEIVRQMSSCVLLTRTEL